MDANQPDQSVIGGEPGGKGTNTEPTKANQLARATTGAKPSKQNPPKFLLIFQQPLSSHRLRSQSNLFVRIIQYQQILALVQTA
jgi:hypothetical protein